GSNREAVVVPSHAGSSCGVSPNGAWPERWHPAGSNREAVVVASAVASQAGSGIASGKKAAERISGRRRGLRITADTSVKISTRIAAGDFASPLAAHFLLSFPPQDDNSNANFSGLGFRTKN